MTECSAAWVLLVAEPIGHTFEVGFRMLVGAVADVAADSRPLTATRRGSMKRPPEPMPYGLRRW